MKINRDHFLAAAFLIGAMNTGACKAKIGEDATPEGTNQAEGVGSPTQEGAVPVNQANAPAREGGATNGKLGPLKGPAAESPTSPAAEHGWGSPAPTATVAPAATNPWGSPAPTTAPAATTSPWGKPQPTAAPAATTKPGWSQPKPPPPPPAPANNGWTQPKK